MGKRVLLDENIPHRLRRLLAGHTVVTTAYQGWAGKKNGALIALAEENGFDVMVTADQALTYQQNMAGRRLALVVLSTGTATIVLAHAARILASIDAAQTSSYTFVDIGH